MLDRNQEVLGLISALSVAALQDLALDHPLG
jgi:hypothetical protein